ATMPAKLGLPGLCTLLVLLPAATAAGETTPAKEQQLVEAVRTGHRTMALALLADAVDPDAAGRDGTTALHWAVRNNDAALVDRLIAAGADVHAANRYGVTAIYLACQNGSAEIVGRLLSAGVDANTAGRYGET